MTIASKSVTPWVLIVLVWVDVVLDKHFAECLVVTSFSGFFGQGLGKCFTEGNGGKEGFICLGLCGGWLSIADVFYIPFYYFYIKLIKLWEQYIEITSLSTYWLSSKCPSSFSYPQRINFVGFRCHSGVSKIIISVSSR